MKKLQITTAILAMLSVAVLATPEYVRRQAERIAGTTNLPPTARTLEPFLDFTGETTISQMFHTVGMPDTELGAGIPRYFYRLADGSEVSISGGIHTALIIHTSTNGTRNYLVMTPSQRKQLEQLKAAEQQPAP